MGYLAGLDGRHSGRSKDTRIIETRNSLVPWMSLPCALAVLGKNPRPRCLKPVNALKTCARMMIMQQPQAEPIHWDNHRGSINLTLILALGVVVIGMLQGTGQLVVIGLAVAAYSWFTNPKQYLIYPDTLVIVYGRPRVRSIPFTEISHVEMLSLPIGNRLRVRLVSGRRIMLTARDSETFHDKLDEALNSFHGTSPAEETQQEGSPEEGSS